MCSCALLTHANTDLFLRCGVQCFHEDVQKDFQEPDPDSLGSKACKRLGLASAVVQVRICAIVGTQYVQVHLLSGILLLFVVNRLHLVAICIQMCESETCIILVGKAYSPACRPSALTQE